MSPVNKVKTWTVAASRHAALNSTDLVVHALLRQRGVAKENKTAFLQPRYLTSIHDPYQISDMGKAVARIYDAVKNKEQIIVWGDYDVDGVSSTAILVLTLKKIGAQVVPFIPHRTEGGYGLHQNTLAELQSQFDLLITVDCGISNSSEVAYLNKQNKDVIIVDHHAWPLSAPKAHAILHPAHPDANYPFPHLCGAGMAWKLAVALLHHAQSGVAEPDQESLNLLDLVCLGTIGDVVPLLGENRTLVKYGLSIMSAGQRPAMKALQSIWSRFSSLRAQTVAYYIAPLINAAGRMDHAQPALDLLLSSNLTEANQHLNTLRQLNNQRRSLSQQILQAAENQCDHSSSSIIFAADNTWPSGVVGLVAGRLCDKYGLPAFVVGGAGELAVGSARAPSTVNLIKIINVCQSHLLKYGGHARAAGFSLEFSKLNVFKESLLSASQSLARTSQPQISGHADIVVSPAVLNWDLTDLLQEMEPFGEGNQEPQFIIRDMYLGDLRWVGKNQEHAKFAFRSADNNILPGIGFGLANIVKEARLTPGDTVDILGKLTINEYQDRRSLQLHIKDVARTGEVDIQYEKAL